MHGVDAGAGRTVPAAYVGFTNEHIAAAMAVLRSGMLASGPEVPAFEQEYAAFIGARHAIAVSNGTTALEIALQAYGIGVGAEVITTPFSFFATTAAIVRVGATPVFADIDERTFLLDTSMLEQLITYRTKAILVVDLFGHMANVEITRKVADAHGVALIVDGAQAHGASWRGHRSGSLATTTFSFYATKNLAIGEGGMITTNDDAIAERCRSLRNHGSPARYVHDTIGTNARMSEIHGAIGRVSLLHLAANNAVRKRNAEALMARLAPFDLFHLPVTLPDYEHAWHLFTVRIEEERDSLVRFLNDNGVAAAVHYPTPTYRQPVMVRSDTSATAPRAERVASQVLSLPVHPGVSLPDVEYMVEVVNAWQRQAR